MEKGQLPIFAELDLVANTLESTGKPGCRFVGGSSKPQARVLHEVIRRKLTRKQVDRIAAVSNGPDVIMKLRARGLELPCHRIPCIDREGAVTWYGVYIATAADIRKVRDFLAKPPDASSHRRSGALMHPDVKNPVPMLLRTLTMASPPKLGAVEGARTKGY